MEKVASFVQEADAVALMDKSAIASGRIDLATIMSTNFNCSSVT